MTRHAAVPALAGASLGLALLSCGNPTESSTERVIGTIDPSLNVDPVIEAPAEARAGVAFKVTCSNGGQLGLHHG